MFRQARVAIVMLAQSILMPGCASDAAQRPSVAPWSATAVIGATDVDAAVRFYADVLGFDADPSLTFAGVVPEEGSVYAIVVRDGLPLHLQIRRRSAASAREAHEVDIMVTVTDVDALFAEYSARGVHFIREVAQARPGVREFTIEDPFSNRITFVSAGVAEQS